MTAANPRPPRLDVIALAVAVVMVLWLAAVSHAAPSTRPTPHPEVVCLSARCAPACPYISACLESQSPHALVVVVWSDDPAKPDDDVYATEVRVDWQPAVSVWELEAAWREAFPGREVVVVICSPDARDEGPLPDALP